MCAEIIEKKELVENPEVKEEEKGLSEEEKSAKIVELEEAKKGLTEQLIAERTKKQEAEAANLAKIEEKVEGEPKKDEVETKMLKILKTQRDTDKKVNAIAALKKFQAENKEFHPENDVSGIKMELVEAEVKNLNTNSAHSVDDFVAVYKKALGYLVNTKQIKPVNMNTENASTTPNSKTPIVHEAVTAEDKATMERKGWNLDKLRSMKEKYPQMFEN